MSIQRLKAELLYTQTAVANLVRSSVVWSKPIDELPLLDMPAFTSRQDRCLTAVDKGVNETARDAEYRKVCLFLGGSLARLEFFAKSDLDFLAVDMNDAPYSEAPAPGAQTPSQRLALFEQSLAQSIAQHFGETVDVGVGARPFLGDRAFFTRQTLFDELGREHEANWAAWGRAVLLFEAAAWGDAASIAALREEADKIYAVTEDLTASTFPAVCCSFLGLLAKSGLLAKMNLLRKLSPQDGTETTEAAKQREQKANSELIKAVFSRHWYSVVNRLVLHALYWCSITSPRARTQGKVRGVVRATPIYKMVHHAPRLIAEAYDNHGTLWGEIVKHSRPGERVNRDEFSHRLLTVYSACGHDAADAAGRKRVPMWCRFLQVLKLCMDVREGKSLDDATLDWLARVNEELEDVLASCRWVTSRLLPPPRATSTSKYHTLMGCIRAEVP